MMDMDQVKAVLLEALPLRPPTFERDAPGGGKVAELEEYLLTGAHMQAELEEALHWLDALTTQLREQIEQMVGYEQFLPSKPQGRVTGQDIMRAKRTVEPAVFELGAECKQLRQSIVRQIDRLRFEAQWPISRAYSMISGG